MILVCMLNVMVLHFLLDLNINGLYGYSANEIQVGKSPNVIAVNDKTDVAYVGDGIDVEADNSVISNAISIINGSTRVVNTVSIPVTKISDLAVNSIQNKIYVIGYTDNLTKQDIYIINGTNNDIKKCISIDAYQLKYANIDSTTDTLYTISYSSNGTLVMMRMRRIK